MKTYGIVEVQLHEFLNSVLYGSERSVLFHGNFIPVKRGCRRLGGP
jgi:hypothetical protein